MPLLANVTSGDPIAPSWGNTIRDQTVQVCTAATHPGVPTEGMVIYETDTDLLQIYNGTAWVPYGAVSARPAWVPVVTQSGVRAGTASNCTVEKRGRNVHGACKWTSTVVGAAAALTVSYPPGLTPVDNNSNATVGYGTIWNAAVTLRMIVAATTVGFSFYAQDASNVGYAVALGIGHNVSFNFDYESTT